MYRVSIRQVSLAVLSPQREAHRLRMRVVATELVKLAITKELQSLLYRGPVTLWQSLTHAPWAKVNTVSSRSHWSRSLSELQLLMVFIMCSRMAPTFFRAAKGTCLGIGQSTSDSMYSSLSVHFASTPPLRGILNLRGELQVQRWLAYRFLNCEPPATKKGKLQCGHCVTVLSARKAFSASGWSGAVPLALGCQHSLSLCSVRQWVA